jgi:DNA-binding transcriptional MerR regulator
MGGMQETRWTLDELAERVDTALAVDYHGQPSGRVRAVPDRRAIRWYTTIGLIDRPVAHRGRTALYGPRHLLQLVAVKRLQAKGLPLVAIQRELAGATDTQLARVARIPAAVRPAAASDPLPVVAAPDGGLPGKASGAARSAATAQPPAGTPRVTGGPARRATFWRERPAAAFTATAASEIAEAGGPAEAAAFLAPTDPDPATTPRDPGNATGLERPSAVGALGLSTLQGVRLGEGATLLLEPGRELDAADLRAIVEAAKPLLAALRHRGLDGPGEGPASEEGPASDQGPALDRRHAQGPGSGRARGNDPRREHR